MLLATVASCAPETGSEAARPADEFVDSMCVATHWLYFDTPYGQRYPEVRDKLTDFGVRHVRDSGSSPDTIDKMQELAALGIKTTFILDPNTGTRPDTDYWGNPPGYPIDDFVESEVGTDVIDAVEMHNEVDVFYGYTRWFPNDTEPLSTDPSSRRFWGDYIPVATRDTSAALKGNPATAEVPLFGPSFTSEEAYATVGDLSSSIDAGNVHWYLAGRHPETEGWGPNGYGSRGWVIDALAKRQSPSDPLVATEGGYSTATGAGPEYVPETVHAKYMPRLYLHAFNGGFERFCSYEFVDEREDPEKTDPEANFGLLRNDLSEKPAYTALRNLIGLLEDPRPDSAVARLADYFRGLVRSAPGSLDYALGGDTTDVEQTLLLKRDGTFYLVLWVAKPSWDPIEGGEIRVPSQRVTLTLDTPTAEAATYLPNTSASPIRRYEDPEELTLEVPDHPLVVELVPR